MEPAFLCFNAAQTFFTRIAKELSEMIYAMMNSITVLQDQRKVLRMMNYISAKIGFMASYQVAAKKQKIYYVNMLILVMEHSSSVKVSHLSGTIACHFGAKENLIIAE